MSLMPLDGHMPPAQLGILSILEGGINYFIGKINQVSNSPSKEVTLVSTKRQYVKGAGH